MPQNNLPGTSVTGQESVDQAAGLEKLLTERLDGLEASLKQQLGSQLQEHQAGFTQDTNQKKDIELVIHGKKFTFADAEAASKAVEEALVQTREMTAEAVARTQNGAQPTGQNPATNPNAPNKERFAELATEDPFKGLNYALGQLVFGQEVPNAGAMIRDGLMELQRMKQVQAASEFRRIAPGFTGTPEQVSALEQVRQEFGFAGDNPKGWQASYEIAVQRGLIKPQGQEQQAATSQTQSTFNVPPNVGRETTANAPNWVSRAEKLPTAELEKFLMEFKG